MVLKGRRMAPLGRVLIAHNDPAERARLRALAEVRLRLGGTVEADSFETLLERLREANDLALVLVDLDLAGMNWEVGLRYLADNHHDVRVAVLSSSLGRDALEMLAAVGTTVLPKQLPEASLVEMVGRLIHPHGNGLAANGDEALAVDRDGASGAETDNRLTQRQCDVLRLLSDGHSNLAIAHILGIAEGTVKVHINAAFRTLGVHNRVSAAVAFREHCDQRLARQ
jgi:DNA-binding NarL/FixJ family response regulator